MASFEVGAGVSEEDAPRKPFLRAVLSDGSRGAAEEEGDREVVVRDRFARLDAGLPPLPESDDESSDEDLSPLPTVHRPAATSAAKAAPAPVAPVPVPPAKAPELSALEETRTTTWQHLAPAPPRPISTPPGSSQPTAKPLAPPKIVATPVERTESDEPGQDEPEQAQRSRVVPFEEEEPDAPRTLSLPRKLPPRSLAFEDAADEMTESVADGFAISNAKPTDAPQPSHADSPFRDAAEPQDEQEDAPKPRVRTIFRAFSG
ncbi:hypothetical protein LzC2_41790 [Planctomycetes bacterium LzC2]|uniref:Uncharacterized protein n=2 Tax=Alienimonas chondri TaxID=2681879 RepID=A0ABX1VJI3_9PLAN|nr:hypothetical protein [Alienimonas chondri]